MPMSPLAQALSFQNSRPNAPQEQIQPANVLGAYQLASQVQEQNYQQQLAKQMAMWGGLTQLGGAGILGFGPTLAKKYFGAGVTPAGTAGAAAPTTTSGIDAATGAPYAASSTSLAAPAATDAGTVAADLGTTGAADTSSVAADYGLTGASDLGELADLAPAADASVAGDLAAATAPEDLAAIGDAADFALPDIASLFAFLA